MKLTTKSKLTYKVLFRLSLVMMAVLIIAVPVFATTTPTGLLDFALSAKTGRSLQDARPLTQGVNVDRLNPGEEHWYTYSRDAFADTALAWISLALRYESEAVISADQVNFEVSAQKSGGSWLKPSTAPREVLGVGLRSPLKTSESLSSSFWTGQAASQEHYYVRVFNTSPFGLDYTLEAKAQKPPAAIPASFNASSSNEPLNTRQMVWSLTAMAVEKMTAAQASEWMQQAQAAGWIVTANTPVNKTPQPAQTDSKVLWSLAARAIEGQDAEHAAAWLIQADSLGWLSIPPATIKNPDPRTETDEDKGGQDDGTKKTSTTAQPQAGYTPVSFYPNQPLIFDFNQVNSGRLTPNGEHWYALRRDDLDKEKIEKMALTLFFTPLTGYMSQRVTFELFPASQYHVWARGDADKMQNFGAGQWISRDNDPKTGERLWSGSLVDGDSYFVKVKNGSDEVIDYYLFPGDVQNAELGQPNLHPAGTIGQPAPTPAKPGQPPQPGAAPPEAIPLKAGVTTGALVPGEEKWYKFEYFDAHNEKTPSHDFIFYLTNTPANYVRARHADFAIYPASQLHIWQRGDTDQLKPLGASSVSPNKTKNPQSLQVLWRGQLMEKQTYYIKIYNHDIGPLQYEFDIQGGP